MANSVTFDVAGKIFDVQIADLQLARHPEALLTRAVLTASNDAGPIQIGADAVLFPFILDLHKVFLSTGAGRVTLPTAISKEDFVREAQKFGLQASLLDVAYEGETFVNICCNNGKTKLNQSGSTPHKQPSDHATSPTASILQCTSGEIAISLISCLSWKDRSMMMRLNKYWKQDVFGNDTTWQAMCSFLHREEFIYSSSVCTSSSWHALFTELWPLRSRWSKAPLPVDDKVVYSVAEKMRRERAGETDIVLEPAWLKPVEATTFNMSVFVRVRPQKNSDMVCSGTSAKEVVLPLHQRIARIQQERGCSREEAFEVLFGAQNGDAFDQAVIQEAETTDVDKSEAAHKDAPVAEDTDVNHPEAGGGNTAGVVGVGPKEIMMCAPGIGMRPFTCFDSIFTDTSSQAVVFEAVARRQVADFINGLNCTVFCYGQTGSGKTHTLFGSDAETATGLTSMAQDAGLVPRICAEISAAVSQRQRFMDECKLQLSYIEVYGEEVSDLLQGDQKAVNAWKGTAVGAVLDGRMRVTIDSMEHLEVLLKQGEAAKRHAATEMNSRSSRAHTLLILSLTQTAGSIEAVSNLCLADLGGSEQLTKSGATGERMQEAIGINMGLLALKQCIRALNNKAKHVPYHDSKLTELLSSGLGGNSKTSVVITAAPGPRHAAESMQALRFGEACAVVSNVASAQQSSVAQLLAELNAKIKSTEAIIEKKERWERFEEQMPVDEFGDGGGIRTRMKLVGAEKERGLLESCLKKRRALLGEAEPDEGEAEKKNTELEDGAEKKKKELEAESFVKPTQFELASRCQAEVPQEASPSEGQPLQPLKTYPGYPTRTVNAPAESKSTEAEAKENVCLENKAENVEPSIVDKEEQLREERRAAACAKAAEREARATQKREEMLAAKKEKARIQQERVARQQELRRAKNKDSAALEEELAAIENELAEAIKQNGVEYPHAVALAAKAEDIRQKIKAQKEAKLKTDKAVEAQIFSRKTVLSTDGDQPPPTDSWQAELAAASSTGAAPALSAEEQALISEHKANRLIASHQATDWK